MNISVIICTHNPRRDYLSRTLSALQRQTLPYSQWELLVIDNMSREPVSESYNLSWHPKARHVRENRLGLTYARLRGIAEAKGGLLVFFDDDNVADAGFLDQSVLTAENDPSLGAFGAGRLEPEFEIEPPPELVSRLPMLALRTVPTACTSSEPHESDCIPWGAGLCVTREIADEFSRLIRRLRVTEVLGRRGNQLFSGEDNIFSWVSAMCGKKFGIFPELRITHLISVGRLKQDYFVRLIHDHAFSHGVINYLLSGREPQPVGLGRYVRLLLHGFRCGSFSMRCRLAEIRGQSNAALFIANNLLSEVRNL